MLVGGGYRAERNKGEKWDNCNSIINKIYFKKQENGGKSLIKSKKNANNKKVLRWPKSV